VYFGYKSDMSFTNIFSQSVAYVLHLNVFNREEFSFNKVYHYFVSWSYFWSCIKKSSPSPKSPRFSLLASGSFIVLNFTSRCVIHF
jgi:hypothetical protein